ncbi:MFS general substrate transporter [Hortaea werneckii]|nr:MFS general substrate transporter [Hortaea werneckii]
MSLATEGRPSEDQENSQKSDSMQENKSAQGGSLANSDGEKAEHPTEQPEAATFSAIHEIAFIFMICMAQFLALAGLAQSIAPLGIIGRSFGVRDEGELSWYPAAFSLTVGTFILPAGRLGDMYGHRNLYVVGFAWYAVWSVIAGVAVYSGDILFSIARAFQGIGCSLLVPNALAIVGRTYGASPKKNMIFALFGAAAPTGWTRHTQSVLETSTSSVARQESVDLYSSTLPGTKQPCRLRDSGNKVLRASTGTSERIQRRGSVGTWCHRSRVGKLRYLACAQNSPVAITGLCAAVATGFLLSKIKVSYVLLLSTLFFLIGQILIATAPVDQIYWAQTFVSIIIMPWGMDMSFPSGTIVLSNNTPRHDQGIASSLVNTTVNYSISLALGIAGTVRGVVPRHWARWAGCAHCTVLCLEIPIVISSPGDSAISYPTAPVKGRGLIHMPPAIQAAW